MGCSASSSVDTTLPQFVLLSDPTRLHVVYERGQRQNRLAKLFRRCFQFHTFDVDDLVSELLQSKKQEDPSAATPASDSPVLRDEGTKSDAVSGSQSPPEMPSDASKEVIPSADDEIKMRINVLTDALSKVPPGSKVLVESFPKSLDEMSAWENTEFCKSKTNTLLVLTPEDLKNGTPTDQALTKELIKRKLNRFIPETTNPYQVISFGHKSLVSAVQPIVSPSTPQIKAPAKKINVNEPVPTTSVLCIIGGSGSSKKRQTNLLAEASGYVPISMGPLLVAASESDPQIRQAISRGVNVPSHEIVCEVLQNAIQEQIAAGNNRIIIEGFPRNREQLDFWMERSVGNLLCDGLIYLHSSPDVLRNRLIERRPVAEEEAKAELTDHESHKMYAFEGDLTTLVSYIEQERHIPFVRIDDEGGHNTTFSLLRRALNSLGISAPTALKGEEEVTFAMIKPDAVANGFEDDIIADIVRAGFKILKREKLTFTREHAEEFYEDHRSKFFFPQLMDFMTSGPIVALALCKRSAVSEWRRLMGPADARKARVFAPGSLRARYGHDNTFNAVHGSDSAFSANRELKVAFGDAFPNSKLNRLRRGFRIVLAGGPASGKGTQAEMLRDKFGVVHISTGELLRSEKKRGTELGCKAAEYFENGQLVPDDVMIPLVLDRLAREDCQTKGWMLDGFPRTGAQAEALSKAGLEADIFILLDVDDATLIDRVTGRRSDKNTGKIYHLKFNPPPPDVKPEDLEQRADDTEEKIKHRIETFKANVSAVQNIFRTIHATVDGNRDKFAIFEDIMERMPSVL